MNFALTPDRIAAAYSLLCSFAPISRWGLVAPNDAVHGHWVTFHVARTPTHRGWYIYKAKGEGFQHFKHSIFISSASVGSLDSLLKVTAHEMIHMHQQMNKLAGQTQHNRHFHYCAKRICRTFAWDLQAFL